MRIFEFEPRQLRRFDFLLALLMVAMMVWGFFVIWGVTGAEWSKATFARKDLLYACVGFVAFLICCFLDLKTLEWASWIIYAICLLALIGVYFFGHEVQGAKAWYSIFGVTIQPAEFMKIATVMVLANYMANNRPYIERISVFLKALILIAIPAAITVKAQNDTGTALTFGPIFLVMVFMAGVPKRILVGFFGLIALAVFGVLLAAYMGAFSIGAKHDYQLQRISHVLGPTLSRPLIVALHRDPEKIFKAVQDVSRSGYQSQQARVAMGSGQIFGKGWGKGTQTKMSWLPSAHKDTIFASLCEQFGMMGCMLLLLGYSLMVWRCARISLQARDMFCSLLAIGLTTIFVVHIIVNAGMNVDLLPVIGIPLPFMSYGGSFLVALCIMFGLIVDVGMRKFIY